MTTVATRDRAPAVGPLLWADEAACVGHPELTDERTKLRARKALMMCRQCPVIEQCRAWAEAEGTYVGVAGGRVFTERRSAS